MKKLIVLIALQLTIHYSFAHRGGHHDHETHLPVWELKNDETLSGTFISMSGETVYIELPGGEVRGVDIAVFKESDQEKFRTHYAKVQALNGRTETRYSSFNYWLVISLGILIFGFLLFYRKVRQWLHVDVRIQKLSFVIGLGLFLYACGSDDSGAMNVGTAKVPANDATAMAALFGKFSGVSTSLDGTYLHVSSDGLPEHSMMVGITAWNEQVPVDQSYSGSNSWSIPLQPEFADNPLSTKTNFLKGAIAIAVNGIPIFNPLNNRGEDTKAIGELDQWGGHSGRADDYHYHLPPTHLESTVGNGNPIAYALDGFPVYGKTSEKLDEYLGIQKADGSYQYHTIDTYPYFIASMRGKVSLDPKTSAPENQILPQAFTKPVRSDLDGKPQTVNITGFQSTGTNKYTMTYTQSGKTYTINYSWDANGNYTFEFVNPDGTTTKSYKRN